VRRPRSQPDPAAAHRARAGDDRAAAILVTVPLIALVLFFQDRIVEGLTAGAVKG
jgi:trehalose/maltose transport system permease protein